MKKLFLFTFVLLCAQVASAQISAKLMRYVDVSENEIAFVYGGDIWLMPKAGGQAVQITHLMSSMVGPSSLTTTISGRWSKARQTHSPTYWAW